MPEDLSGYSYIETLNEEEQKTVREYRDHNLRVAGDDNPFQEFKNFDPYPTPDGRNSDHPHPLRNLFEWEAENGMVWHITNILNNEQFVMKSTNMGPHVMVWNSRVKVRLAWRERLR